MISSAPETVDVALSAPEENDDDLDVIPELAKLLLNTLSTSGLPGEIKRKLSERARNVWKGWIVDFNDIEFIRRLSGDRKCIGQGGAAQVTSRV